MSDKADRLEQQVERVATPVVERMGLEFVAAEVVGEPAGKVVRIYLDEPGGIDLDTLAEASRALEPVLERELPIQRYRLEVSSPGLERPLVKRSDFERFVGSEAQVRTRDKIDGRRNFRGTIEAVEPEAVHVRVDDKTYTIRFEEIAKANLVAEV